MLNGSDRSHVTSALDLRRSLRERSRRDPLFTRISVIWALLFFNVLGAAQGVLLPVPHTVAQLIAQSALIAALVLALTVNPGMKIRPNWFLTLYSLLAITSIMMSIRLVSLGTAYRSFRLLGFLLVLWLLTPWWGRRDLLLLRSQMRFLLLVLSSVIVGLLISPHQASPSGRLSGILWPIPSTQVAHYSAEVTGLVALLWMCRLVSGRVALLIVVPTAIVLVMTHTRTALLAMLVALLVAGISLFPAKRRVRKAFVTLAVVVIVVVIPASPFILSWLARGQGSGQISNLTGRTNPWSLVVSNHRPATNLIFGDGLSNDSVVDLPNPAMDGAPIDSSWVSIYQDQGIVGEVLVGGIVLLLLLTALFRAQGPTRALALFLILYCSIAGISETGLGTASQYLLDLAVAASLLTFPSAMGTDLTFSLRATATKAEH